MSDIEVRIRIVQSFAEVPAAEWVPALGAT